MEKVNENLFVIYKRCVQQLSRHEVIRFVSSRRYNSKKIKNMYIPIVVGMIFPEIVENKYSYNIKISAFDNHVTRGKVIARHINMLVGNYEGNFCSCDTNDIGRNVAFGQLGYDDYYHRGIDCPFCLQKMFSFANDCTIKLGRCFMRKKIYNFLIFYHQFNWELVGDVLDIIGLLMFA